jgi:hypothetical protein
VKVPAFYAHTLEGEPPTKRQGLQEHLLGVARLAAGFARAFGSESWGYCAGLWHDLAKCRPDIQRELSGEDFSAEQSGSGAAVSSTKSVVWALGSAFEALVQSAPSRFRTRRSQDVWKVDARHRGEA